MVYSRKRKYARKGMKKRFPRRRKTTLTALSKAVSALQKKTKTITERDQYYQVEGIDVASPYVVRNLSQYSDWTKMWASTSTATAAVRSSMYHRYFKIDNLVTLDNTNNEEGTINFTYMIISRRDTAGTATDTTNNLSLTNQTDYSVSNGSAYINLKKWKIHYVKRFTLTGGDGADMQADQCQKRFTCTIRPRCRVTNPDGSWTSLQNSPDPSDTFYAILFNDNSSADLENPRWTFNAIHSVDN